MPSSAAQRVVIDYVNWRGVREKRLITPMRTWFGTSKYHAEDGDQWFIAAYDHDRRAYRDFAVSSIISTERAD